MKMNIVQEELLKKEMRDYIGKQKPDTFEAVATHFFKFGERVTRTKLAAEMREQRINLDDYDVRINTANSSDFSSIHEYNGDEWKGLVYDTETMKVIVIEK